MHFYNFHIGDYKSHTEHLDPIEDIAYRRMIDYCYLHEKGLPNDTQEIARLIRMRSHCDSIETVLREFFTFNKKSKLWNQNRIQNEISKFKDKSEKAKSAARARWEAKSDDANALPAQNESNANQEPITNNQEPITKDIVARGKSPSVPYQDILNLYHECLPNNPQIVKLTPKRKGMIKQRWESDLPSLDDWREYFTFVADSKFLTGRAKPNGDRPPFRADIDFLARESTVIATQEGKYHG